MVTAHRQRSDTARLPMNTCLATRKLSLQILHHIKSSLGDLATLISCLLARAVRTIRFPTTPAGGRPVTGLQFSLVERKY